MSTHFMGRMESMSDIYKEFIINSHYRVERFYNGYFYTDCKIEVICSNDKIINDEIYFRRR